MKLSWIDRMALEGAILGSEPSPPPAGVLGVSYLVSRERIPVHGHYRWVYRVVRHRQLDFGDWSSFEQGLVGAFSSEKSAKEAAEIDYESQLAWREPPG